MKNLRQIKFNIEKRKYTRKLKSKKKKKLRRFKRNFESHVLNMLLGNDFTYYNILLVFLPKNLKYLVTCEKSHLYLFDLYKSIPDNKGRFLVPGNFSLIDQSTESYEFIRDLTATLIFQKYDQVIIDYSKCSKIGLEAQVYLDVIIKELFTFFRRCSKYKKLQQSKITVKGENINNDEVRKLLFSVGSPVVHAKTSIEYDDIISYKLVIHNSFSNSPKTIGMKDSHTTELVDYVLNCLARLHRTLAPEKLEDLCIVISEILINAEEHSSTNFRFSIGYFTEATSQGEHYGVFRLVILNFGQTIYEKFKDPACPNEHSVNRMKELSKAYNKKRFFVKKEFEEETLWTLYSLQEGITSTDPKVYSKRGNGSLRFIESFFNIKGNAKEYDDISSMNLMSGQTHVSFDGTYNIVESYKNTDRYQYMTFNKSGSIMNKPDDKFVRFVPNYFPGTFISAEILFNEDDHDNEIK